MNVHCSMEGQVWTSLADRVIPGVTDGSHSYYMYYFSPYIPVLLQCRSLQWYDCSWPSTIETSLVFILPRLKNLNYTGFSSVSPYSLLMIVFLVKDLSTIPVKAIMLYMLSIAYTRNRLRTSVFLRIFSYTCISSVFFLLVL